MSRSRSVFPVLALLLSTAIASAADDPCQNQPDAGAETAALRHIPRIAGAIKIDGVIDEHGWTEGLMIELDVETRPGENIAPPVRTEVMLGENGTELLVAFRAHDPDPGQIRAFLRDRDSAWSDDFVGITLDTFNDERFAFEFFVNPFGSQMDLTNDDVNQNEDSSWDAIWDSAGRITAQGYEVEMAIPLQQLRFPRTDKGQIWGIDVLRFYPRSQRHRIANNKQDRSRDCYLCQLEKIRGFACVEPGRNLLIAPTLTINQSDTRTEVTDPLVSGATDFAPGLDLRWGITPDLTLTGTLNPDFSQVEADVAQLSVNEQFELFFPEKRPFFLESADFFQTWIDAVFTRTVADPDFGAKLIGKQDVHNYGLFIARDTKTNLLFPGADGSDTDTLLEGNNALAARYRRDFGKNSMVGLLVTARDGDNYSNRVAGIDGRYRLTESDTVAFQYLASETEYPEQIATDNGQPRSLSDSALALAYDHRSRNWHGYLRYDDFGPEFRADLGFVPQVGFDRSIAGLRRTYYPGDVFTRIQFGGDWDISHTPDGRVLEREVEGSIWVEGPMQSFLEFGLGGRDRLFDDILFAETFVYFYGEFQPVGGKEVEFFSRIGKQIDFDNSRLANNLELEPSIEFILGKHLQLRLQHAYQSLDTRDTGANIFTANLSDIRLTWQFDVRSFLRLVVQHQDIKRDPALYVDDVDARSRSLATQLLYSYKVNPQTVLFVGYSDAAEDGDLLDRFTKTDRTLFAKIGYAWLP